MKNTGKNRVVYAAAAVLIFKTPFFPLYALTLCLVPCVFRFPGNEFFNLLNLPFPAAGMPAEIAFLRVKRPKQPQETNYRIASGGMMPEQRSIRFGLMVERRTLFRRSSFTADNGLCATYNLNHQRELVYDL
jgi:hypothetical protein